MKPSEADSVERRLRLLLAREFAARRYLLDAESIYDGARTETMSAAELELLARVAALRGDWPRAEKRFELLAEKCGAPEQRSRVQEWAAFAQAQSTKPPPKPKQPVGVARSWWRILLAFVVGAVVAVLVLWALGMVALPMK